MTDRGHTDPASQYVDRLAGYDQRLQSLERSHTHEPETPVGAMIDWPAPTPPNLWHVADGASLLAAAYPDLFAVIGYTYGGSGASFNLPDTRGRVVVAAGAGPGLTARSVGARGGAETVGLTAAQNGTHAHGINFATAAGSGQHSHPGTTTAGSGSHAHTATTTTGSGLHSHPGTTNGANARHQHAVTAAMVLGGAPGSNTFVFQGGNVQSANDSPDHGHTFTTGSDAPGHQHVLTTDGDSPVHQHAFTTGADSPVHQHTVAGSTDGGGATGAAHENMPPFVALVKIIKILPSTAASLTTLTIIERTR
jgi:microcystin-dependent protein